MLKHSPQTQVEQLLPWMRHQVEKTTRMFCGNLNAVCDHAWHPYGEQSGLAFGGPVGLRPLAWNAQLMIGQEAGAEAEPRLWEQKAEELGSQGLR